MNLEFKKIRIHTLTPLFIGDGTEYSRLDFWFDMDNMELVEFKQKDLIETLTLEEKNNLGNYDIKTISDIINKHKPHGIHKKVSLSVLSKYNKEKKSGNFENQFKIKRYITDTLTQKPYLPGSSLKGALRTGYIYSLRNYAEVNLDRFGKPQNINEDKLLGKFSEDIFSSLKISDLMPEKNAETFILYADRVSKKVNMRKKNYEHLSVTMFEAVKPGCTFTGEITLLPKKNRFESLEKLLQASEDYSFSLFEDDKIALMQPRREEIESVIKSFGSNKKVYLVRLGGLIGAESHTIDGFRNIKIKLRKGSDYRSHTTRNIYVSADEKSDMNSNKFTSCGWCLIEIIDNPSTEISQEFKEYTQKISDSVMPLYEKEELESIFAFVKPLQIKRENNRSTANCAFTNLQTIERNKVSLDRNSTYQGTIIKFSKKGKPIVDVQGNELTVTNCGTEFKIGDIINIGKINSATCQKID